LLVKPTLRAPAESGDILAVPPLAEAERLAEANRARLSGKQCQLLGQPLHDVRKNAMAELATAAMRYLDRHELDVPRVQEAGFIVTGHQPELYHPGVWIKNFAASSLGRRLGLNSVHVIIDNDVAKNVSVKVPQRLPDGARIERVPLDHWNGPAPYEELRVQDEPTFQAFPAEVAKLADDWPFQPVLTELWQLVGKGPLLGERLAVGRHRLETRWGCTNLEVPLSDLCRTATFARFAGQVLSELPRFWSIYNDELAAYRRRQHIRSTHHPAPDLARQDDWLEAPFWVWRAGQGQRGRLFVRQRGPEVELRQDARPLGVVQMDSDAANLIRAFKDLASTGIKIRTRALTTTLFIRLCFADLFIHGIGGAIYDELTDRLMSRFFGVEAPSFLTLSATLRLPFDQLNDSACKSLTQLRRVLRDQWYQPERWLREGPAPVLDLIRAKGELIEQSPATGETKIQRWRSLQDVTEQLRPHLTERRLASEQELVQAERCEMERTLLRSREFAFCLYPAGELRELMAKAT
jgi:hypothetical protein